MKKLLLLGLMASTAMIGCKKKENAADDKGGSAGSAATAPAPAPAPAPTPGSGSADTAAPAAGGIASSDDYKAKANTLLKGMMDLWTEQDCDKLAAKITGFLDANKPQIDGIDAWEKAHPDDKKAFEASTAQAQKDFEAKATPVLDKCKNNKAMQDAIAKLPQ